MREGFEDGGKVPSLGHTRKRDPSHSLSKDAVARANQMVGMTEPEAAWRWESWAERVGRRELGSCGLEEGGREELDRYIDLQRRRWESG